jgi:WD40 repeat protein/serine/threonine protein kinase
MSGSDPGADQLGRLADEFLERFRRGERPAMTEYTTRYPELADQIRELFPTLVMMEDVRPGAQTGRGGPGEGFPQRLGEYRIIREIGRGGMGVVYEAEQESLGRRVALKVLPPAAVRAATQVQRFEREARAAARLHHTNVVPVFGVGAEGGTHYYVMQYIEGRPLDQVLAELRRLRDTTDVQAVPSTAVADAAPADPSGAASCASVARSLWQGEFRRVDTPEGGNAADLVEQGRPDPRVPGSALARSSSPLSEPHRPYAKTVAQIGVQVAEALEYAAGQGVLHRDVKPSNLLLDVWGTVWLTDFGLAAATGTPDLTSTGDLLGTLRYMAPERFEGRGDARSDVYSLGLTLYEMLALRPAFAAEGQGQLINLITTTEPPRLDDLVPGLPRDLVTIVRKATARDPADRYPTAAALADDLRRFLDDRSIVARRSSVLERGWRWCRRNRTLATSLGMTVVALVVGSVVSVVFAFGEKAARERADQRERDARESESRATASAEDARREVEKLYVANGRKEEDDGNLFGALLWLVRPLQEKHGPMVDEATHRLRLGCYFRYASKPTLLQVLDHQEEVTHAAFSPDGHRVLTAGEKTAQLWDAATGRRTATLPHGGRVLFAAFSPDGGTVVTASWDNTARLWDAATGRLLFSLHHQDVVVHAAFSPDGRSVVTASHDRSARVWSVADGTERRPPLLHQKPLKFALFSPDGRWILTCTDHPEARVLLWDAKKPKDRADAHLQSPTEPTGSVNRVAFSPDGNRVVIVDNTRSVQIWDVTIRRRTLPLLKHTSVNVTGAAFSPDGRRLVTAELGGTVRFWDTTTGEPTRELLHNRGFVTHVAFSPDGGRVVTAGWEGMARIWDAHLGVPITPWLPHQHRVTAAAFSPDGGRLLTASWDGTARIWDTTSEGKFTRLMLHEGGVKRAAFSPEGSRVVTASMDGTAQVWDAATTRPVTPPLRHEAGVFSAAFSPEGSRVVTASIDGTARVWHATSGRELTPPLRHPDAVFSALFSPDGRRVVTAGHEGTAQVWDANTGEPACPPLRHNGPVNFAAFSPDGGRVVTASDDGTARVWNAATGEAIFPPLTQKGYVTCVAFSPDGRYLVTGSQFDGARVWDAATGQSVASLSQVGLVECVAFSPDGRSVVTANSVGTARLWEAATGRPLSPAWGHGSRAWCAAFSPDGRLVATCGSDGTARVWEGATGQPVTPPLKHDQEVYCVAFSPDGRTLLSSTRDGAVRLWDLVPDDRPAADLVLEAQLLSGRQLDAYGALDRMSVSDQLAALATLRAKYPARFRTTPEQVRAWHRREADRGARMGDPGAAIFHTLRGYPGWPLLPAPPSW